jgi:polar amino acid transport system substrate-binding protein/cystine transport system substrate-binding protein
MLRMTTRWNVSRTAALACATLGLAGILGSAPGDAADGYKLVEPGKLTIATTAEMPGIVPLDGELVGYDGEILQIIADRLGLEINPVKMEWSGVIASVQAGRMDVLGGNVGWTEQRTGIMALTDPTQYFQNGITHKADMPMSRLADLEGRNVATITGFSFVPELEKIKDISLSFYDTLDAALRDLLAGRVDAVIADPPVMGYAIALNPDWNLAFTAFEDDDPAFPQLTGKGRQFVLGVNAENRQLAEDMNTVLRELWADCTVRRIGAKYGMTGDAWFLPGSANPRAGVDRPADWTPPSCAE